MNHINWEEIRNKYIYGVQKDGKVEFPTVQDLSKEYGIDGSVIGRHSSKEGWVKARGNYINERSIKSQQKVIDEISDKIAPFDTDLFNKAKTVLEKLNALIEGIDKPYNALLIANTLRSLKELEKSVIGEGGNENPPSINIVVNSEEGKDVTEKIIKGEGT